MTIEHWLAFVVASTILLMIPGPTILTVISYSIAHGRRANIPLVLAVALGDSTALVLSLAGLGAVLATSAWLFTIIKFAGGLYLMYLGICMLTSKVGIEEQREPRYTSTWQLFRNTWLVTALNPKGIIFFVAFLPQFLSTDSPAVVQLWILSLTFVTLASLNAMLYAVFATKARALLSTTAARKRFNCAGGSLLFLAGGWAMTANQPAS